MGQLEGKRAIVTGAGTGIGRAIAERFCAEGAVLAIAGRRAEKLSETATAAGAPDRVTCIQADVTVEDDVKRLVDSAAEQMGGIDILVNNAGVMRFATLPDESMENWDLMMRTNVWAVWRTMVYVIPHMISAGGGSIVNISSIAGIKAFPGAGGYCASKAAMQVVSQTAAMENAAAQVRVNCILPAVVEGTELFEGSVGAENVETTWARFRPAHPMGRNGRPTDIADAAVFLASDQSAWVTGILLNVDGGRHLATNRPAD